jgi:hypothetical protein
VIERNIYIFIKIDNKKQYKLWLYWQPKKPEPVTKPEISTPYPQKRMLKKEISIASGLGAKR